MMKKNLKRFVPAALLALSLSLGMPALNARAAATVPATQSALQQAVSAGAPAAGAAAAVSSAAVPAPVSLKGKKVSILGDSISTFTGTMPADYNIFYPESGDIPNAGQTWWGQLLTNTGMVLCRNASSSNTDVTGNSLAMDGSAPGCSIRRVMDLKGADGSSPDVIIIYMGINDFARSRTLGSFRAPGVQTEGEVMVFTDAYELMLQKIKTLYPTAAVYCCTLLERCDMEGNTGAPSVNLNGDTVNDFNAQIKAIASAYGASVIDFYNCGINYTNLSLFTVDGIHPTWIGAGVLGQCATQAVLSSAGA